MSRVKDRGTKLSAFLYLVPSLRMSGAVLLRRSLLGKCPCLPHWSLPLSTCTQYACDMCHFRIKQWVEICRCGCVRHSLARQSDRTELVGWSAGKSETPNTQHPTPKKEPEIWFYLKCLRNSPHLGTAACQLHATVSVICNKYSAVPVAPMWPPPFGPKRNCFA